MTLFEMPPEKLVKHNKPTSASKLAGKDLPLYEVTAGLTKYFLRASSESDARRVWRFKYEGGHVARDDAELKVRRLFHADIAALIEADPKLASRLNRL